MVFVSDTFQGVVVDIVVIEDETLNIVTLSVGVYPTNKRR